MDNLKYFPLYFNRFMDGIRGYDAEFIGIYIMLLCRQAETHRIPNDLPKLSRWMGGVEVEKIKNVLSEKFECDEHGFYNIVMVEVLQEVVRKSESARKSANDRWNKIREKCERNANESETHIKSYANDMLIKERKVKKSKGKEKKEGIAQKFVPPTLFEVIEYFKEKEFSENLAKRAFEFYDTANWIDSKGNKVKNWKQKMLSVWLKEENKNPQNGQSKPSRKPATIDDYIDKYKDAPFFKNE